MQFTLAREALSRMTMEGARMFGMADRTSNMPPLKMAQARGLPWGLGSDATAVTPLKPFATTGWAVTGKMVGGKIVYQAPQKEI